MDGIINVYKEPGFTSHDVVAKLRGILHMKKIGHTGTLDPDAQGVLPVCVGRATKLCGMITDWGKTYEAVMLLGKKTDTQDISGNIVEQRRVSVDERMVLEAATSFVGGYEQIPPMYSALKHNGKKLYELARQGIEIERKPRHVNIDFIRINEMNLEDEEKTVTFTVSCSKGTYIRTLINDIGEKLGCGACMVKLIRTRVGRFVIDESLTLNQISALVLKGTVEDYITSADELFDYPKLVVREEYNKLLYNGNRFAEDAVCEESEISHGQDYIPDCEHSYIQENAREYEQGQQYRIYDAIGNFIGIYAYRESYFVPVKIFYSGERDEM
jgi:tRNA pseudouridine55 synthase